MLQIDYVKSNSSHETRQNFKGKNKKMLKIDSSFITIWAFVRQSVDVGMFQLLRKSFEGLGVEEISISLITHKKCLGYSILN